MIYNIISYIISVIGFAVTIIVVIINNHYLKKLNLIEFENSKKNRLLDKQIDLYTNLYAEVERIIHDNGLIHDETYFENVFSYRGLLKIIGSDKVITEYGYYIKFLRMYKQTKYGDGQYVTPDYIIIREKVELLLDSLRNDLGNDKYKWEDMGPWQ